MLKYALQILTVLLFSFFVANAGQAENVRKLIFIPGIVGSELSNENGDVVWGRVTSLSSRNFEQLNLLPDGRKPGILESTDALRKIPVIFGNIGVGVYSGLIDYLTGEKTGSAYTEDENLFVFHYDWRRSNFANAFLLDRFIAENIPADEKFDIVAHSMGGLLTRVLLSEEQPNDFCIDPSQESGIGDELAASVCTAAYGQTSADDWRTRKENGPFSQSNRLHTFIEIATPHKGSVNVASTLVEGWGRFSQLMAGGKRSLQDVLLSMVSAYELIPTYENCCAIGKTDVSGNVPVSGLDENFWAKRVLGFGQDPCPYSGCEAKRALLKIGLQNRAILDRIVADGVPDTVEATHIMVGRLVEQTRTILHVAEGAVGNGDGITYTKSSKGDGTVYEGSAKADGTLGYIHRSKHAFITASDEALAYVYNTLVNPIEERPELVSSKILSFAGGLVDSLALSAEPQIVGPNQSIGVRLDLVGNDEHGFDEEEIVGAAIDFTIREFEKTTPIAKSTVPIDSELSFLALERATYVTQIQAPSSPGVYVISANFLGQKFAQELLYVLEP